MMRHKFTPGAANYGRNFRGGSMFHQSRFRGAGHPGHRVPFDQNSNDPNSMQFDGKRMRKAVFRKTLDYNCSVLNYVENRVWQRDQRDRKQVAPDSLYAPNVTPPPDLLESPMNCVTTRFIRTSLNKIKCPIFCVCWTPEGRRLVTGASSGEFTLWNGLTFNFETILQAHETSVRAMIWSHNDQWMLTADHAGFVKYWQSNMNNVRMYQAHKDPVRGLSFCPTDAKFASCSDDGTVRVWDFLRCHEERILRGHGADVKCVNWHPQKALLASGSKDTQQPVKLWDPRTGNSLATIHAHKHTVMEVKWNKNGNWLLTASRDHLIKIFDIRKMKDEFQTFKGHKKEAMSIEWHPIHESLFASGGSDGALMFWLVGHEKEVGSIEEAHEAMVWTLSWHPLGHILASGSNDHTTKFWTRNRPGDTMRDKYNLNTLPIGMSDEMMDFDVDQNATPSLPGMGLEYGLPEHLKPKPVVRKEPEEPAIPGLDFGSDSVEIERQAPRKKVPFAKPIPKRFEEAWQSGVQPPLVEEKVKGSQTKPGPRGGGGNTMSYMKGPPPHIKTENINSNMPSGGASQHMGKDQQGSMQGNFPGSQQGNYSMNQENKFQGNQQGNNQGTQQGNYQGNFQDNSQRNFQGNQGGFQGNQRDGFQGSQRGGFQGNQNRSQNGNPYGSDHGYDGERFDSQNMGGHGQFQGGSNYRGSGNYMENDRKRSYDEMERESHHGVEMNSSGDVDYRSSGSDNRQRGGGGGGGGAGNYGSNEGGYGGNRSYDNSRGGFNNQSSFNDDRGGYNSQRGNYNQNRGGYRGRYSSNRGGYDSGRGGYSDQGQSGRGRGRGGPRGGRGRGSNTWTRGGR